MALNAALVSYAQSDERRGSGRRTLRLQLPAMSETGASPALVYNLSERGLLLETDTSLQLGDVLIVELPEAGATPAEVIWARDGFAGCRFGKPLPAAAVSAALLRADPKPALGGEVELPARTAEWEEPLPVAGSGLLNIMVITALVIGLVTATLFIIALLSFPFSAG